MESKTPRTLSIEEAAQAFAALGSEQRLAVLTTLVMAGPEGLMMGELGNRTGIAASTLTHHLRFLTQAGLVTQEKRGRAIYCAAAAYETVELLSRYLLLNCCADAPNGASHEQHASCAETHE
jgi:ArsR family transcriptional regulator, arsenate/arsenite/antimonite-responsive transcriptional repressor